VLGVRGKRNPFNLPSSFDVVCLVAPRQRRHADINNYYQDVIVIIGTQSISYHSHNLFNSYTGDTMLVEQFRGIPFKCYTTDVYRNCLYNAPANQRRVSRWAGGICPRWQCFKIFHKRHSYTDFHKFFFFS